MSTVTDVAINVINEDVDCPNIRVCQQNSENVPNIATDIKGKVSTTIFAV